MAKADSSVRKSSNEVQNPKTREGSALSVAEVLALEAT